MEDGARAVTVPFPRSYWVEPGRLLAGYYPGDRTRELAERKLGALLDRGIRTFVDLTEEREPGIGGAVFLPYEEWLLDLARARGLDVTHTRFAIRDITAPSHEHARTILDAIDASLAAERPVYVHCRGGIGRTGTVVACWLVRHGLAQPDGVIARVKELRAKDPSRMLEFPQCDAQEQLATTWRKGE